MFRRNSLVAQVPDAKQNPDAPDGGNAVEQRLLDLGFAQRTVSVHM
jgi:hypothetical protein